MTAASPQGRNRLRRVPPLAALGLAYAALAAAGDRLDRQAPILVVQPAEPALADGDLVLRARIDDDSGVASATVWVKGERDESFRPYPLTAGDGDGYSATLPPWPARGGRVTYWVEATDVRGNGPRRSGSPRTPFVATIEAPPVAEAPVAERSRHDARLLLLLAPIPGIWAWWRLERRRPRNRRRFGKPPPVAETPGMPAIPEASLEALWSEELPREISPGAGRREIAEEVFWLHLLAPVLELPPKEADRALRELAGRPHPHPGGARQFDLATFREKLRCCRETDPWEVVARFKATQEETTLGRAAGVTLVEALVVLAVLGIATVIGAISFDALEAPVKRGRDLVAGAFEQARASAMATTTAHRVRAVTDRLLVVEDAPTCSSGSWTVDHRRDVRLPDLVTLGESPFSVCFDSRGVASTNLVVSLNHPRYATRSLEVLMGGAVRPR